MDDMQYARRDIVATGDVSTPGKEWIEDYLDLQRKASESEPVRLPNLSGHIAITGDIFLQPAGAYVRIAPDDLEDMIAACQRAITRRNAYDPGASQRARERASQQAQAGYNPGGVPLR